MPIKRPKSALDVIKSESKSLAWIVNNEPNGELKTRALITLLITETLDFFSITNSMSDTQIAITVNLILDEYVLYKPDFFQLCFDNAKKFKYGKNYNRIDGQIIFEWLEQCDADYTAQIENERVREHKRINSTVVHIGDFSTIPDNKKDIPVPMPDNVKELITTIGKRLMPVSREVVVTEQQKRINEYIQDFNDIFEFHYGDKGGKKFIPFFSGNIDVSEFIKLRADRDSFLELVSDAREKSKTFIWVCTPVMNKLLIEDLSSDGFEFTDEQHPKYENLFRVTFDLT